MATSAETIDSTQNLLNINMSNINKLTSTNYLTWNLQVNALLDGYALAGYVDGSTPAPDATVTTNSITTPNPAFVTWKRQDRLIFSALLGTISPAIQTLVSKSKTSAEMWKTITSTYAKPSRGHIQQLKQQLIEYSKGEKTIDEYLQGLVTRFDQLALLGKPLDHDEQIDKILAGLPEEYKSLAEQIEGRDVSPSIIELHEKLLTKEAKIISTNSSILTRVPVSANYSSASPRPRQFQGKQNPRPYHHGNNNNNFNQQQQHHQPKQDQRISKGYQGRCQLCGVFGHSAKRCTQLQQLTGTQQNPFTSPFRPWQPRANLALASSHPSSAWLMDSGATHHMTSDLHTLHAPQSYNGSDDVLIGDGSGLTITHTGEGSEFGGPIASRQDQR
ncbi:hypothetical protein AALP_AA5G063300 [Arabis alpina]|uniref:CCHC-type domain-containing protein n=1 Tax=Arabis alpina TaxID=50452 RepID=A0A087GVB1_ARAAL|nr:hypothetical protein AALP_AA5G063300 [Arabis alpina]